MRLSTQYPKKVPGLPPGTLVYEGEGAAGPATMHLFNYNKEELIERTVHTADEVVSYLSASTVTWLDIEGIHDVQQVADVGRLVDLHPLTLEDIVHTRQRPKLEEYPEYLYLVLQMLHYDHERCLLSTEQVSLVIGQNLVLSFQEAKQGDVFEPVRQRLRDGRGHLRQAGVDYLAYALLDLIVDYYMNVLEGLGEHIEDLEDQVTAQTDPSQIKRVNTLRRYLLVMRRSIWPVREVTLSLDRTASPLITSETKVYLRDVYDHTVRTMELIDSSREMIGSIVELYLSTQNHRLGEITKVLTIIATFFLPVTFIAGVYGMNFNPEASPLNMPELDWFYGYPFALGLMLVVAGSMYAFFRHKGWF